MRQHICITYVHACRCSGDVALSSLSSGLAGSGGAVITLVPEQQPDEHARMRVYHLRSCICMHACVCSTPCAACEHSLHTSCIFLPEQQPASRAPPAPRSPAFPAASPAPARSTGALRPGTAGGFALCHTRCAGGTPTPVSGPRSLGQVVSRCHTREAAVGASTRKAPPDARLRQPGR